MSKAEMRRGKISGVSVLLEAERFIKEKDEDEGTAWSESNEDLVRAFVDFCEIIYEKMEK